MSNEKRKRKTQKRTTITTRNNFTKLKSLKCKNLTVIRTILEFILLVYHILVFVHSPEVCKILEPPKVFATLYYVPCNNNYISVSQDMKGLKHSLHESSLGMRIVVELQIHSQESPFFIKVAYSLN